MTVEECFSFAPILEDLQEEEEEVQMEPCQMLVGLLEVVVVVEEEEQDEDRRTMKRMTRDQEELKHQSSAEVLLEPRRPTEKAEKSR